MVCEREDTSLKKRSFSERRIWIGELVDINLLESDGKKIYSDMRADTAISPVPLALKHSSTLPKEYPSEPDDLEQEEQSQQQVNAEISINYKA